MSDTVLAALIGAIASIIVNLISQASRRKKRAIEDAVKDAELKNQLQIISQKLDEHNGYAEKIGGMAIDIAVIKTDIRNIKERSDKGA